LSYKDLRVFRDDNGSTGPFPAINLLQYGPVSLVGIATGYGLEGPESIPGGGEIFVPVKTGPGAHPFSCTMGTGSLLGVKNGRGLTLTLHNLLVPWSRKSRAIPLFPL